MQAAPPTPLRSTTRIERLWRQWVVGLLWQERGYRGFFPAHDSVDGAVKFQKEIGAETSDESPFSASTSSGEDTQPTKRRRVGEKA